MLNIRLEGKLPIYEQLYNGISRLISSGELEPDERLPAGGREAVRDKPEYGSEIVLAA